MAQLPDVRSMLSFLWRALGVGCWVYGCRCLELGFRSFGITGLGSGALQLLGLLGEVFRVYMGGCQNYGPFLGPCYNTAPIISGAQKGTLILTTTHRGFRILGLRVQGLGPCRALEPLISTPEMVDGAGV